MAAKHQVSSDLGGETAILDLNEGVYYGLDEVGTRIWEFIQEPRAVSAIRDAIVEEYDVEPARCERDVLALLQRLVDKGLVETMDEPGA